MIAADKITQDALVKVQDKIIAYKHERVLGLADGKFTIPDDIDKYNNDIALMFGV